MIDIRERAKRIKLLLLDIDGVMTDGHIIYGNYGDEIKNFDVHDGLGVMLVKRAGLKCAIITAKGSPVVKKRAKVLRIDKVYMDIHYKIRALPDIKRRFRVNEDEICYIGDDIIDVALLKRVGLAVAVANARDEVKQAAHYVTERSGGRGAVREICEIILKSQGKWETVTKPYFE